MHFHDGGGDNHHSYHDLAVNVNIIIVESPVPEGGRETTSVS